MQEHEDQLELHKEEKLNLKNKLKENRLQSEHLEEQISEEEKMAYLKHQPLLPYTILIEENQINIVKYVMKQFKEWSHDIPL
ncbi:MAG: hypothetical protein KAX49_11520 [Halanaerobiales bacterium]|nr:hypothetical protein [Halanaerobiales bacterium]